ncbi:protein-tyrosine phosphatase-like protein [Scleroderma yunnanense]
MSPPPASVPEWIAAGRSEEYLYNAFTALSNRERQRSYSRMMSLKRPVRALPQDQNEATNHFSVTIGGSPDNQWANRYSNIMPYNRTRVVISRQGGCTLDNDDRAERGRYFNGNWVRELYGGKLWIATQAPLEETSHSFLSAIAQPIMASSSSAVDLPAGSRIRTVVQLTLNHESGRQKAHSYFPSDMRTMMRVLPEPACDVPAFRVALLEQKVIKKANCLQSKVSFVPDVANPGEPIVFTHMLYMAWPDHGVPEGEDLASLLEFIRLVDRVNQTPSPGSSNDDPEPPAMINCSAGIGRTGTFIALSSLLRALGLMSTSSQPTVKQIPPVPASQSPLGPLPKEIQDDPVVKEIDNLREQRPRMVERIEQAALIYEILELAFSDKR